MNVPRPTGLVRQLVGMPRVPPPIQPGGEGVNLPQNLPGLLPYGRAPMGQGRDPGQTGGVVQNPVGMQAGVPPTFQPPTYPSGLGGQLGAGSIIMPPRPPQPTPVFQGGAARAAIGGPTPPPGQQTAVYSSPRFQAFLQAQAQAPSGVFQGGNIPRPAPVTHPAISSALIAALAGQGRKVNPSAGGGRLAV